MINKKSITRIIQILLALGILTFLCLRIDLGKINIIISHTIPGYLCLAFLAITCQIIVASYRWLGLLRLAGFHPPMWQCVGSFAAGTFFNTTLPGGFVGDIMRTWVTARNGVPKGIAAYTVISDRILGIIGYTLLIMTLLLFSLLCISKAFYTLYIIVLSFCAILLTGFVVLGLIGPITNYMKIKPLLILLPVVNLSHMIGSIFKQPYKMLTFFVINLIVHFTQITAVIMSAYALNTSISPQAAFIGIPIVLLLSAVPITPGNWGIRESTMVFVLGQFQVSAELALVISILFGVISTLSNLPAAIWWFLHRIKTRKSNTYSY